MVFMGLNEEPYNNAGSRLFDWMRLTNWILIGCYRLSSVSRDVRMLYTLARQRNCSSLYNTNTFKLCYVVLA
jgi:hypothetical protein